MTKQLERTVKSRWFMVVLALVGLGLFTRAIPLVQATSGESPSGKFVFTKGSEYFSYKGTGLVAIPGRSCTINKVSDSSCLMITYHENVSGPAVKISKNYYSSVHLFLNRVHVSGRQLYVSPDTYYVVSKGDTSVSMATAIRGGLPGLYTVEVFAAGSQQLDFGGQDVNLGQPLDYTITIQEIP